MFMAKGEAILSFAKLIAAATVSSPVVKAMTDYVSVPVLNVPVSVIMAAFAGAGLSLCFGDPVPTRRGLAGQVLAATGFGTAMAVLVADGMGWGWAQKNIAMFALMSAAIIRWFLPTVIDKGKQSIREFKLPFIKKPSGDDK